MALSAARLCKQNEMMLLLREKDFRKLPSQVIEKFGPNRILETGDRLSHCQAWRTHLPTPIPGPISKPICICKSILYITLSLRLY